MARRPVPGDLEDALAASPAARERFWALPPEQLDRWVRWIERARFPGRRRRRIAETVRRLDAAPAVAATQQETTAAAVPVPRDDAWTWVLGLALLLGLAAFLVWLTVLRKNDDKSSPSAVVVTAKSAVPRVTGLRLEAAQFQLKEAKLGYKIVRRPAKLRRNLVVAQAPKADKQVVQGTVVSLVVSKGRAVVRVPKLVGLAAADAVQQLQGKGLTAQLKQTPAAGAAPGTVVSQAPQAGKLAKRGTPVALGVAKGASAVVVPDVTGQTQQEAENGLQQRGLNVTVAKVASPQPAGTVVAQNPPAQTKVQQGTSVRINVAKPAAQATTTTATTTSAATTTAPRTTTRQTTTATTVAQSPTGNDYRGVRLSTAVRQIAQGRQQVIVQYVSSTQPAGVVVANSNAGNKVRLQVSAGPHPQPSTSVPDTTGSDGPTAQSDLQDAGFSVVTVTWPVSDETNDGVVVYQTPSGSAPKGSTVVIYVGAVGG